MDLLSGLLIWCLCGIIAAAINHGRGNSIFMGLLAGVILGPFGIILTLVTGKNKTELERRESEQNKIRIQNGELKKCPYCAEIIKSEARVCRYCGRDLAPIPET